MVMTVRTSNNAKFNTRFIHIWHRLTQWKGPLLGRSSETSVNFLQNIWSYILEDGAYFSRHYTTLQCLTQVVTTVRIKRHVMQQQRCHSDAEGGTLLFVKLTGSGNGPSGTPA